MYNQIKYYKYNNRSWTAKLINSLNKYEITLSDLLNTNKLQWKHLVNNAVLNQSNKKFIEEAQKGKKLHPIVKYKKEITSEKYFSDLSVSHARTIFSDLSVSHARTILGAFWRPIDQDQVLTTWSGGRQKGLILNLRSCDVTALQAIKSNINIY